MADMRKILFGGVAALSLAAAMAFLSTPQGGNAANSDTYRQLNLFGDVFELVRKNYVDPVDDATLVEYALTGMLTSLDPHSSFLNQRSFKEMQEGTRGEFSGLGLDVSSQDGYVRVVAPIDDTPAARAGIRAGDLITHLDGQPTNGLTLNEAVQKMRGPANTRITLTIRRQSEEKPFDVTITRAPIRIQSVRSSAQNDVGYVRISSFNEQTETGLERAMTRLKEEIGADKIKGYVLDLRSNPGGLLDQAVSVSDAFLDRGEIVSTRGRQGNDNTRFNARRGDLADGKPVVVIIDGGSASASEIVAGALQDHNRALVIGTRSFGKGSVQTIRPMQSGVGVRLTTARYYTPSGRSIQAKGISPDMEILPKDTSIVARAEAELPRHLEERAGQRPAPSKSEEAEGAKTVITSAEERRDPAQDVQLQKALELIRQGQAARR